MQSIKPCTLGKSSHGMLTSCQTHRLWQITKTLNISGLVHACCNICFSLHALRICLQHTSRVLCFTACVCLTVTVMTFLHEGGRGVLQRGINVQRLWIGNVRKHGPNSVRDSSLTGGFTVQHPTSRKTGMCTQFAHPELLYLMQSRPVRHSLSMAQLLVHLPW